jgi:prevent-host-death family protein
MTTYPLSEARAHLAELVTRVENGEEITITRHGRPVASIVAHDRWVKLKRLDRQQQATPAGGDIGAAPAKPVLSVTPDYDLEAHIAEIRKSHGE